MSAEKIGDIKEQLKSITDSQLAQFIEAYGSDERGGVIKLVDSAKKRLDKYEKELIRIEALKKYEREYASYAHICGIDEVGRVNTKSWFGNSLKTCDNFFILICTVF